MYDSSVATKAHIKRVGEYLQTIITALMIEQRKHDSSKLESPEKEIFDEYTPKLKETEYNSEEYKHFLQEMKPALDNHYKMNSHHPEHFENGIHDMNIAHLISMIADWCASVERNKNGDIKKSIEVNKERFGYDDSYATLFNLLADYMQKNVDNVFYSDNIKDVYQELEKAKLDKDNAYLERNKTVVGLAKLAYKLGYRVLITKTKIDGWDPAWENCIYIELPSGQISWHFHDREKEMFSDFPYVDDYKWDGHDTEEKYRRVLNPVDQKVDESFMSGIMYIGNDQFVITKEFYDKIKKGV